MSSMKIALDWGYHPFLDMTNPHMYMIICIYVISIYMVGYDIYNICVLYQHSYCTKNVGFTTGCTSPSVFV